MKLYCANCGKSLQLTRKALPKLGVIVDLVSVHECSETPIPFDLAAFSDVIKPIPVEGNNKFVESLNKLEPSKPMMEKIKPIEGKRSRMTGTDDLRDRRFDQDKKQTTAAPLGVLDQIKQMSNSIPARDLVDDSTDSEMGG